MRDELIHSLFCFPTGLSGCFSPEQLDGVFSSAIFLKPYRMERIADYFIGYNARASGPSIWGDIMKVAMRFAPSQAVGLLFLCMLMLGAAVTRAQEASQQEVLTNEDIVAMVKAHSSVDVIVNQIRNNPANFTLTTKSIIALQQRGVPEKVILAMQAKAKSNPPANSAAPSSSTPARAPSPDKPPEHEEHGTSARDWKVNEVTDRMTGKSRVEAVMWQPTASTQMKGKLTVEATCDVSYLLFSIKLFAPSDDPKLGFKQNFYGESMIPGGLIGAVVMATRHSKPWVEMRVKIDDNPPVQVSSEKDFLNYADVFFYTPSAQADAGGAILSMFANAKSAGTVEQAIGARTILVELAIDNDSKEILEIHPQDPSFKAYAARCGLAAPATAANSQAGTLAGSERFRSGDETVGSIGSDARKAVNVPGNQAWTPTGVLVNVGTVVKITASGRVSMGAGWPYNPPVGRPPNCGAQSGYPAGQLPCWSLIGRIGERGTIFYVGSGRTLQAADSGQLYLGVNDNRVDDNKGSWTALVSAQSEHAQTSGSTANVAHNDLTTGDVGTYDLHGATTTALDTAPPPKTSNNIPKGSAPLSTDHNPDQFSNGPFNSMGFATHAIDNHSGWTGTATITKDNCRTPLIDNSLHSITLQEKNNDTGAGRIIRAEKGADGHMHATFISERSASGQEASFHVKDLSAAEMQAKARLISEADTEANTTLADFKKHPEAVPPQTIEKPPAVTEESRRQSELLATGRITGKAADGSPTVSFIISAGSSTKGYEVTLGQDGKPTGVKEDTLYPGGEVTSESTIDAKGNVHLGRVSQQQEGQPVKIYDADTTDSGGIALRQQVQTSAEHALKDPRVPSLPESK